MKNGLSIVRKYPEGAMLLTDLAERITEGHFLFYFASRKFRMIERRQLVSFSVEVTKYGALFLACKKSVSGIWTPDSFSVLDRNLVPNFYNDWYMFWSLSSAENWAQKSFIEHDKNDYSLKNQKNKLPFSQYLWR